MMNTISSGMGRDKITIFLQFTHIVSYITITKTIRKIYWELKLGGTDETKPQLNLYHIIIIFFFDKCPWAEIKCVCGESRLRLTNHHSFLYIPQLRFDVCDFFCSC